MSPRQRIVLLVLAIAIAFAVFFIVLAGPDEEEVRDIRTTTSPVNR